MLSAAHSIYLGINSSFVWSKGEKVKEDGEKSCSRACALKLELLFLKLKRLWGNKTYWVENAFSK